MKIHIWVPEYELGLGGIQALSRFIVRAARDCFPSADLTVLAKNDASFPDRAGEAATRVDIAGYWNPSLRTIAFTCKLLRAAWRERPDLILTTHVNFAPVAHVLQKVLQIPFVALGNGIEVWSISSRPVRQALRAADMLLAISECTRLRMAKEIGVVPSKILLFPCTFDSQKFSPAPKSRFLLKRYGLQADQPVILTIARLASAERYKGYDQVLKALVRVRENFPTVRYILGGRGPDRSRVMKLISELGLADNVILAGYIPNEELNAHYNLCDIFAMPSKGEGFGIVFLEALACGKPVIAGNKDGSVDALLNGRLGVLVDPDNVDEIAEAMIRVLEDQRSDVSGQRSKDEEKVESRNEKVEDGGRTSEVRGQTSEVGSQRSEDAEIKIPEIMFDPERLRREVIEAYGYQRFKERLAEVVQPLVSEVSNQRSEV
jgi:glycosyltransferase involved in cell wall biosynthesis